MPASSLVSVRSRIGYLHVPKTAGSSVTTAVRSAVAARGDGAVAEVAMDRTVFGDFDRFEDLEPGARSLVHTGDPAELGAHDVLVGHFALPTFDAAGFERADVAMLLREPRARLLSLYTFWWGWDPDRHRAWHPYDASGRAAGHDWAGFLGDPGLASQTDNVVLRMLLGRHEAIPPGGFVSPDNLDALVEEAAARLGSLGHVGLLDLAESPWAGLESWLGAPLEVPWRNATGDAGRVGIDWPSAHTARAIELLEHRTRGDRRLWEQAAQGACPGVRADQQAEAVFVRQVASVAQNGAPSPAPSPYAVADRSSTLTWDDVRTMEEIALNLGGRENSHPSPGYEGFVAVDLYPATTGWNVSHDLRTPLPLPAGSVARIHTEDFLEHIRPSEIVDLLRECRRVLVPGGRLRIACPDYENPKDRHAFDGCEHDRRNPEHITRTDRAMLEAYLVEAGFVDYEFLQYWDGDRFVRRPVDYSVGMVRRTPDNDPRCRREGTRTRVRGMVDDLRFAGGNLRGLTAAALRTRPGRSLHVTSVIVDVTR